MDLNEYSKQGLYNRTYVKPDESENKVKRKSDRVAEENNPNCTENTKHYLWEFCDRTSIHGFNFLGERGRTIPERIWWFIIIVVALYFCTTQIYQTYQKWVNSPVIVTFATTQTPIWDIPFPAVTICPEIKTEKSRFNYTDIYLKIENEQKLSENETEEFSYMSLICSGPPSKILNENLTTTNEDAAVKFLSEVAPDLSKIIFKALWRGQNYENEDLYQLFTPILTSEGVCYTFNIMDRTEIYSPSVTFPQDYFSTDGKFSQWSLESGYTEDAGIDAYPRRTVVAGTDGGLTILFYASHEDLDYVCGDSLQGLKVTLHHPAEIPRVKQKYFRVPLDESVVASIKPNMMTTSRELQNYNPVDRKCYFTTEKKLQYFNIYNQQNCLVECLTNFTLEHCGCVGIHMAKHKDTPVCGPSKRKCIEKVKGIFLANEVKEAIEHNGKSSKVPLKSKKLDNPHQSCNCLPSCNSLDFEVETSQSDWDWRSYISVLREVNNGILDKEDEKEFQNAHLSRMVIFFKDMQFITSERNELYGQTDFWANCGGLLGLFCGFSFMSAFEILYYLTLRIIMNIKKFGRRYWSGSEELIAKSNN